MNTIMELFLITCYLLNLSATGALAVLGYPSGITLQLLETRYSGPRSRSKSSGSPLLLYLTQRGGGGGGAEGKENNVGNNNPAAGLHNTSACTENENINHTELPSDYPRRKDVMVALKAVRQACCITQALQPMGPPLTNSTSTSRSCSATSRSSSNGGNFYVANSIATVQKADLSPVTVADYAVQSLILHTLQKAFPEDGFIAEEDSDALRADEILCQKVVQAMIGSSLTRDDTLNSIDLGKSYTTWTTRTTTANNNNNNPRPRRVWCLDPIDGTKGFLRGKRSGGQYAIALSLVEDGVPTVGILGCPNLPTSDDRDLAWDDNETDENNTDKRGCIFVASRGGGTYQLPLLPLSRSVTGPLSVTPNDASTRPISQGRFCIGVEKSFSDALGQTDVMAKILHGRLDKDNTILYAKRMDSQAKHGVMARGGAEWYVRLPKSGYREYIWDHAAGNVVIEEAGGIMTDTQGRSIDFSLGPQLDERVNGILMSSGGTYHTALVKAFAQQEKERGGEEWL